MIVVLAVCAVGVLLYSSWSQDLLCRYVNATMAEGDLRVSLDAFRLHFPLDVEVRGLRLAMPGPQAIEAERLTASVEAWPLLDGRASITDATLGGARLSIGGPDSAMYMTINADSIALADAAVVLSNMNINVDDGLIAHGRVSMTMNPVPTPEVADTAAAEPSTMKINIRQMRLADFAFDMRMLPTIDSLGAAIPDGLMCGGAIDMAAQTIDVESFTGRGLQVAYIAPDSATIAATPVIPPSESASEPWTLSLDTIGFSGGRALYTTRGVTPLPGLDFAYIEADSLELGISHFYNRAECIRVPLTFSARERCGVDLRAAGTLAIDSAGLAFSDFVIASDARTDLSVSGLLGMGDLTTEPSTPLSLDADGYVAMSDLALMFPVAKPYLAGLPADGRLYAEADIKGTAGDLDIRTLGVAINGCAKLKADGRLRRVFEPDHMSGDLALSGALIDLNPIKNAVLDSAMAATIAIPHTTLDGAMTMTNGVVDGHLEAHTDEGLVSLVALWDGNAEGYQLDLSTDVFPVGAFMPTLGVGSISADVVADGSGLDFFAPTTTLDATLDVSRAEYMGHIYSGIAGQVSLADGQADVALKSADPAARFDLNAAGNLSGDAYTWTADLSDLHTDLRALGFSPSQTIIDANLSANATIEPEAGDIAARLVLHDMAYTDSLGRINLNNVTATLNATDSTTNAMLHNRDLYAFFSSEASLDTIVERMARLSPVIDDEIARRVVDIERVQRVLPPFVLDVNAGSNNFITDILGQSKMGLRALSMTAANDSSLSLNANVIEFHTETMRLDTIGLDIAQYGPRMILAGKVDNRPGTFDEWAHVQLDGYVADNRLGMTIAQQNIAGRTGYDVGLDLSLNDSTLVLCIDPTDPTIAYQPWEANEDNYIMWSFEHNHIDANLHMQGAGSSLAVYTNHVEGEDEHQEDLVVDIVDINIADWIKLNPFAPPMEGKLSANMVVSTDHGNVNGDGAVTLADFMYDRQRVGTIGADLKVNTDLAGRIRASADMSIDGVRTITLAGALNDSTSGSPLALDFSMIHFPLKSVNPFLPAGVATLSGTLNGRMDITGTGAQPDMNGWLRFDSAEVKLAMTGTTYPVSGVEVPVVDNVVTFRDFAIAGVNGNPLALNGSVSFKDMSSPEIDLTLGADEFLLCDTKKASRGASVYGRGLVDVDASVKGNMNFLRVNAALSVLPGTNITYVMSDAEAVIQSQSTADLVKFVNFADTLAVAAADSIVEGSMAMIMQASLTINTGSTINVDLSSDGHNKVRLLPEGTVNMSMLPFSDPRLTGRINITSGFARYTPPFMGEKLFNFQEGSYIAFNGDMLDPTLNIRAIDVVKANVTQTGQNSRLVNFDVSLAVTGTLNNMNVVFDLATDDDVTVANELQSMSSEQRANQAMNMLLYGMYTGPGTSGSGNLSGNALYSFLSSQLNSWAARTIKGVDLSFGVDQYDSTINGSKSTTTSYSYQVSKSLFNDRFKIVVGGNYSTDANADENFSQNLIKDISFEYFLNDARTMYLRLFRHTGYESILEGEIIRTGVGYVYKRKLTSLRELFRRERRSNAAPATTTTNEE